MAKDTYESAMNKLSKSSKRGDTIIGRMENIKKLGANTSKKMDQRLLNKVNNNEELCWSNTLLFYNLCMIFVNKIIDIIKC